MREQIPAKTFPQDQPMHAMNAFFSAVNLGLPAVMQFNPDQTGAELMVQVLVERQNVDPGHVRLQEGGGST